MFHAVARITYNSTVYASEKKNSLGMSWHTAAIASAAANAMAAKVRLLTGCFMFRLPAEQPGRPEGKREQQQAERDGRRPRRAEERGSERLGQSKHERAYQRARYRAHAAQHADREHEADVLAPDRRLHRLDHDQERARDAGSGDRKGEGELLDADRVDAHQAQRELVLRHGQHGAPEKR